MRVIVNPNGSVEWKKKLYLPGSPIDLPEKEALRLIDKGKASQAEESKAKNDAADKFKAEAEAKAKAKAEKGK